MATKKKSATKKPAVHNPTGKTGNEYRKAYPEVAQLRMLSDRYQQETGGLPSQTTVQNLILWYMEKAKANDAVKEVFYRP